MKETSRHTMGRLIISKGSYSLKHITQVIQTPTIDYLRYLLDQSPNQRLLLFWDGASYHRSRVVQGFLGEVNEGLPPEQWKIHCVRFAPNCPSQNPIEDIWLQAKTWVRRFCALVPSFSHLKWMFEWFIRNTTFDFMSLQMYGAFSKINTTSYLSMWFVTPISQTTSPKPH
jgi:transposase